MPNPSHPSSSSSSTSQHPSSSSSWLRTPTPIKRLFSHFPLLTYPSNPLPNRTGLDRRRNTLFIFDHPEDFFAGETPSSSNAILGRKAQTRKQNEAGNKHDKKYKQRPSFNPSCLKWQTWLLFRGGGFCGSGGE